MDGLKSSIKEDNHRAVNVGHLRKGRKAKFNKAYPEAAIREGADDSTLRAEEVKTLKARINIDHIEENRWEPPLVVGRAVVSL